MADSTNRLRKARTDACLTQQDVASRMGIPRPNVARWESGTQLPRVDTALRLAAILGTTVEALWTPVTDNEALATAPTVRGHDRHQERPDEQHAER